MRKKLIQVLLVCSGFVLAGCGSQNLNTGAVDYRQIDPPLTELRLSAACDDKESASDEAYGRYYSADDLCGLNILEKNDAVSIRILQVYICDFAESGNSDGFNLFRRNKKERKACNPNGRSSADTPGEIVIVADVFEQGDKTIEARAGLNSAERGRVIYYSEDVEETGQFLNLSNIPLYGPVTYTGKPLYLKFFIVEVDEQETSKLSSTLKKLAGLAREAHPPGTEALDILSGIGEAFLSGAQDDLEFMYDMAFDGVGGVATSYAPLAVGTYAFVRREQRDSSFDWTSVRINNVTGRLECARADTPETDYGCPEAGAEFRGETYFTLKVVKNEPAIANETIQLMSAFKDQAQKDIELSDFSGLDTAIKGMRANTENAAKFDAARASLPVLDSPESNAVQCHLALETILKSLCALAGGDKQEDSEQATFLLTSLYDSYFVKAEKESGCASREPAFTPTSADHWSLSSAREYCATANETKDFMSVWPNLASAAAP